MWLEGSSENILPTIQQNQRICFVDFSIGTKHGDYIYSQGKGMEGKPKLMVKWAFSVTMSQSTADCCSVGNVKQIRQKHTLTLSERLWIKLTVVSLITVKSQKHTFQEFFSIISNLFFPCKNFWGYCHLNVTCINYQLYLNIFKRKYQCMKNRTCTDFGYILKLKCKW